MINHLKHWLYIHFGWLNHYRYTWNGKTIEWSDKIGWHEII